MTTNGKVAELNNKGWVLLGSTVQNLFYRGVLLKFKTNDCGPLDAYQYALAVMLDGSSDLHLVSLEGGSWGTGKSQLPRAARFQDKPYTISSEWLKENLNEICNMENPVEDVWYCTSFNPIPRL